MLSFIATVGYIGYFPFAPGTVGSAAGLLSIVVAARRTPVVELGAIVLLGAPGVGPARLRSASSAASIPGPVVIDEIVGMLITLAFIPMAVWTAFVGFLLFRIFDVIKPFPAASFEHFPGGWGVMADDAMAALYANLCLRGVIWIGWA